MKKTKTFKILFLFNVLYFIIDLKMSKIGKAIVLGTGIIKDKTKLFRDFKLKKKKFICVFQKIYFTFQIALTKMQDMLIHQTKKIFVIF